MEEKRITKRYDNDYKIQALKLADEIDQGRAADELGIPKSTIYGQASAARKGDLDVGTVKHTPEEAMSLNEELVA